MKLNKKFTRKIALDFAQVAEAAYKSQKRINLKNFKFKSVAYLDNKKTETQGFIAVVDSNNVIVAFRGTESKMDALVDMKRIQVDYPFLKKKNKMEVHRGFLKAYKSIRTKLIETLTWIDIKNIYVAGHSLGGALTTLASYDIKTTIPNVDVTAYTFGSPRVGNKHFSKSYNWFVPNTYRVRNYLDIVPAVPKFDYVHVKNLIRLDKNGKKTTRKIGIFERIKGDIKGLRFSCHYMKNYIKALGS